MSITEEKCLVGKPAESTLTVSEMVIEGTDFVVRYHGKVITRQRNPLKAAQKLTAYLKGLS